MSSLLVGQVDIGQVGGGHVQGAELVSWQHSVGVEAGAVQHEVPLSGLLEGPAPALGVSRARQWR